MRSSLFKTKVFFCLKLYKIWNEFTLCTSVEIEPVNIDWFAFYFFISIGSFEVENNGDNREKLKIFNVTNDNVTLSAWYVGRIIAY